MEKQMDLRVVKTRRGIKTAFLQIINKKELSKISVAELARLAEINKGTFYLHYSDIYGLYTEMLEEYIGLTTKQHDYYAQMLIEPEIFVRAFFSPPTESRQEEGAALFRPENTRYCENFLALIIDSIIASIYETEMIAKTTHTTMKFRFLIGGMFAQVIQQAGENSAETHAEKEATIDYLISQIKHSFPEFSQKE